ncbi:MAG: hypothetical protein J6X49_02245, partial [Victivallales bacterium]|nr:hypothetical protein [Victivallales bacterium]
MGATHDIFARRAKHRREATTRKARHIRSWRTSSPCHGARRAPQSRVAAKGTQPWVKCAKRT